MGDEGKTIIIIETSCGRLSFALQYGADVNHIRRALCRDSRGRALGPIGKALDHITERGR
jgi:hypothetical protein